MQSFGLNDRVVCVTGGASGIGKACALALAADGASVAIADVKSDDIDKVVAEVRQVGGRAAGFQLDVRDEAATARAVDFFERELGPVDGLIASAGISRPAPAETLEAADFAAVIDVNLTGVFYSCRAFGRRMIARKHGSIVLIGSVDSLGGQAGRTHYVASKHAVAGIAKNLAIEWGQHGIRVNCIAPGFVQTPLLAQNVPANFIRDINDRTPLGRAGWPEEMAKVSLMLLSDACSYVTGIVLSVDGGLTAGPFTRRNGRDLASNKLLEAGLYSAD